MSGYITDWIMVRNDFWRAELQANTVIFTIGERGQTGEPFTVQYPTPAEAQRAIADEVKQKVRIGYRRIPAAEWTAFRRFMANGYTETSPQATAETSPDPAETLLWVQVWWFEQDGRVAVRKAGDIGPARKTYRTEQAGEFALSQEATNLLMAGFVERSLKEVKALVRYLRALNARLAKHPELAPPDELAGPTPQPTPTIVRRKSAARAAPKVKRNGPFAEAFTTPVVHLVKLSPGKAGKPGKRRAAVRATSGGRPILAENQSWPTCGRCQQLLSLYLQLDLEPGLGLGFVPGSHLLVFNCAACDQMAMTVPSKTLPRKWLSPDNPQTYRVILNRPAAREAIFPEDASMFEQRVTLSRAKETVAPLIANVDDTPVGRKGFKIGGLARKRQPWRPPRCACGAPLGFVLQVPMDDGGFLTTVKKPAGFFGLDTFIFACTKQCSAYATIVIPDR